MLPQVMRYNYEDPESRATYDHYGELLSRQGYAEMAVTSWVERLLGLADLPSLAEAAGVAEADLPELAKDATRQWTGQFNPRKMTEEGFVSLYQGALEGAPALIDP
jgi:alcohol dehydrogenase class IV